MNVKAFLVSVGLMCSGFSSPDPTCDRGCTFATNASQRLNFMHVSDLENTSVAPWELKKNIEPGREPEVILSAKCKRCTVDRLTSKPIQVQIWVYKALSGTTGFCKCPLKVAVGCTCVRKEHKNPQMSQ